MKWIYKESTVTFDRITVQELFVLFIMLKDQALPNARSRRINIPLQRTQCAGEANLVKILLYATHSSVVATERH